MFFNGFLALASAVWSKNTFFTFSCSKGGQMCANRLRIWSKWKVYLIIHVGVAFTVPFVARVNRGT